jgi:hypothetical protein
LRLVFPPAIHPRLTAILWAIVQRAKKVWGLPGKPVNDVQPPPLTSGLDATIFLTAAFTGPRIAQLLGLIEETESPM